MLLIDECSTDSSLEIAGTYESEQIRTLKNKTNSSLSAIRNARIRNVTGDYLGNRKGMKQICQEKDIFVFSPLLEGFGIVVIEI